MATGPALSAEVTVRLRGADPRILLFLDAWRAARHGRAVPRRDDFDPMSVASLLPWTWLYRFDPSQDDYVCRLAGEEVKAAWQGNLRGRALREIIGESDHAAVIARWRRVAAGPLIQYGAATEGGSGTPERRVERLVLPFVSGSGEPDHMIGLSLYALAPPNLTRAILVPASIVQIPCSDL